MNSDENDRVLALVGYLVPPIVPFVLLTEAGGRPFVRCHGAHALAHLVASLLGWGGLAVLGSAALLLTYTVEGRGGVIAAVVLFELGLGAAFIALWYASGSHRGGTLEVPLLTALAGGPFLAPFFISGAAALGVLLLLVLGVVGAGLIALWLGLQAYQGRTVDVPLMTPLLHRLGWC